MSRRHADADVASSPRAVRILHFSEAQALFGSYSILGLHLCPK